MLIYIDESGDSGFKFDKGSSAFFTIAMVVFNDKDESDSCEQRIQLLKKELGYKTSHEFHFVDTSFNVRKKFFEAVAPYNFFYYAFVLNKKELYSEGFKNKESFYKYTASLLFENAKDKLIDAKIFIDGSGDANFRKSLSKYLKTKMNDGMVKRIKNVKMIPSHKMNCIQLSDFIASGTNRTFMKKDNKDNSISIVSHRKIHVQVWPKINNF